MDVRHDQAALQRIVALLLALADLADLARDRSPAVRVLVLWLLRPAERVACDFVGGTASGPASPAEALAQNFRTLARALRRRFGARPIVSGRAHRAFAVALAKSLAPGREKKPAPHDTS